MSTLLQIAQPSPLQRLLCIIPWLTWALLITLITSSVGDWILLWPRAEARNKTSPATTPGDRPAVSATVDKALLSQPGSIIHPWFGIFESINNFLPPPSTTIEISQRNLHLIGISTSTYPGESFALIRSGNAGIKPLKTGDAPEPGVELVELLPNAVILKAGNQWEKLNIGDSPPSITSHAESNASIRSSGANHTIQTTTATALTSSIMEARPDPKPRHNDNPNLANRDIRERLNAMMAALQQ